MKILIPVDETDRYQSVLTFVKSLEPPTTEVRFLHVVTPITAYDGTFTAIGAINGADPLETEQDQATGRLKEACKQAEAMGFSASWEVDFGYPAQMIESKASEYKADLIALAATTRRSLERLLSNSTAISIVENSPHNLLIVRGNLARSERLSAVFATDHSMIADQGLDRLLEWHIAGLAHVEVLTAYQIHGREAAVAGRSNAISPTQVDVAIRSLLIEKTEKTVRRFREVGIDAQARCLEFNTDDAIREALSDTSAQLLILSAKEHGFWKSLSGSTSVHETANEPSSLLILRPDDCNACPNRKSCENHKNIAAMAS